jgi:hypothetical protein
LQRIAGLIVAQAPLVIVARDLVVANARALIVAQTRFIGECSLACGDRFVNAGFVNSAGPAAG